MSDQRVEPPAFPVLETERLLLREITSDDVDTIFAIHGDRELMKWFGEPAADREAAERVVDFFASMRLLPDPGVRWGLERKSDHRLIGSCGLMGWRRSDRKCGLGYELAADAQGQGYMNEALNAALAWGRGQMNLVRIEAQIHPDNLASQRLAESVGFEREGLLRKAAFWSGQHHDLYVYGLVG